jgi:tetratricopeptide (TPR) repeat protein
MHGYWDEAERWLAVGLEDGDGDPIAVKALEGAVFVAYLKQDYEATRHLAERQLQSARALGDARGKGRALHMLGNLALETRGRDEARALYEESLSASGEDPFGRYTLHALGYIALLDGDVDLARSRLEESLTRSEIHGDVSAVADTLGVLAFVSLIAGRHVEASRLLRRSIHLARKLGDKPVIATRCLHGAAVVLAVRGNAREAARVLGAADQMLDDIGAANRGKLAELMEHRVLDMIRSELGESEAAEGRAAGRELRPDEALDLALASID